MKMKLSDHQQIQSIGLWRQGKLAPQTGTSALQAALHQVNAAVCLIEVDSEVGIGSRGVATIGPAADTAGTGKDDYPLLAYVLVVELHRLWGGMPDLEKAD